MKILLAAFAALLALAPAPGAAQDGKKKYKVLYITQSKGFVHGSVKRKAPDQLAPSEVSLTEIGKESGLFDVECTQDASVLTPEKLKELDVVGFYTTGNLPITPEHFGAFVEWLKGGKAMIAFHAATDTYHNFKPYSELINGTFAGHPWGSGESVTLAIHDPEHPVVRMLGSEFVIKDEIYQYRNYDPKAVRVLYSLDMSKCKTKMPYHVPVCWVREVGQGRLFYTNLGHNDATWQNPKVKEHLLAGIRWALKLEQGSAAPNPEAQALENVKSFLAVAAGEAGKSYDALAAKAAKLPGDAVVSLNDQIAALRKIDAKKEPDKRKAELDRILAEIEKK